MRALLVMIFGLTLATPALAGGADDPVKAVMDIATGRWLESSTGADYFDKPAIDRLYSKAFQADYHAAEKYPAYDEGSPFDYDVVTAGQDGCPLKDIKIDPAGEKAGMTTVNVSFRLWDCAETAEEKARISTLRFDVVSEDGRSVIDDIHRNADGKWDSLRAEMHDIVKFGQENESKPQ